MARIENWNPPQLSIHTARYEWDVEYAALVHEGGITEKGFIYPARPWTDEAVGNLDFEDEFGSSWAKTGSLDDAFREVADELFYQMHVAMEDWIWDWPTTTRRRNGSVIPEGDRDIIDIGNLYNSQSLEFE
jgi:hypothetical protein